MSAWDDGTIGAWDVSTGSERELRSPHDAPVEVCAISREASLVVSAARDGTLSLWEARDGAERAPLARWGDRVTAVAFSSDGSVLAAAMYDDFRREHIFRFWDADTGSERADTEPEFGRAPSRLSLSPDGGFLVTPGLTIWDTRTGSARGRLTGHTSHVRDCAVSPDGRFVCSASDDCTLKLWDAEKAAERATLAGHSGWVHACAFSRDGSLIVSGSQDTSVRLWKIEEPRLRRLRVHPAATFIGHADAVRACAISSDNRFVFSTSMDGTLKAWDAATGSDLATLPFVHWPQHLALDPRQPLVLCADGRRNLHLVELAGVGR